MRATSGAGAGPDMKRIRKVLPIVTVVAGIGLSVLIYYVTGRHPASVLPGVVYVVATLAQAYTPAGRDLAGLIGLGVVSLAGIAGMALQLYYLGGHNPQALLLTFLLVVGTLGRVAGYIDDLVPAGRAEYATLVAVAAAVGVLVVRFFTDTDDPGSLVHGSLFLVAAAVFMIGQRIQGPGRFALCALVVAVSAGVLYFLAISSAGAVPILLGAVFVAGLLGALVLGGRPVLANAPDRAE
ncbi:hypothetical protein [Actinokineospora enzanensis]|uniref:hypothetical protein n=1 Tax=Actinokineospora enzanensis TaxID=155975 RepID=UPI0003A42A6A|nr:hypothetical protein [Actinokineospora enzanensis]